MSVKPNSARISQKTSKREPESNPVSTTGDWSQWFPPRRGWFLALATALMVSWIIFLAWIIVVG